MFPKVLQHFLRFMNVSKVNPGFIIFDIYCIHLSLQVITPAEENVLLILTFPPHCSLGQQLLDVGIFGPFKRFYNRACDAWMTSFPGQPLTIHYIAEPVGKAFSKAFCLKNIVSSFKKIFGVQRSTVSQGECRSHLAKLSWLDA